MDEPDTLREFDITWRPADRRGARRRAFGRAARQPGNGADVLAAAVDDAAKR
ncbi:hypothetical protein [Burkholderia pseudomultivorans]|uniref:hypothetical protein n=1 Tax=Burkholderia pseudomultivorans TaxID=1207504 RepID=UPI00158CE8C0|nr:hypothetical protein [Burkholderia pseudomultivorans]